MRVFHLLNERRCAREMGQLIPEERANSILQSQYLYELFMVLRVEFQMP